MLKKLRWQLTLWYMALSVFVYALLSAAAVYIFHSELDFVILQDLRAQTRAVRPAIDYSGPNPSLVNWARNAQARKIQIMYTVQLYDANGVLLEEYGPRGIHQIGNGLISGICDGEIVKLHSRPRLLAYEGKPRGYLQIQESTEYRDEAVKQLLLGIWLLAPILLAGLGFSGYIFAGRALKPTEQTLTVLRCFAADVGHELNTSITIIQATLETIEKKYDSPGLPNLLKTIHHINERLANLGDKLILLAKIESPELNLPMEIIDLDKAVQSIVEAFQGAFEKKKVSLICTFLSPVKILAYRDSIATILNNLLENALRYTESGGSVSIKLDVQGDLAELVVEDTGAGIPVESIPLIFDRFYRVDKSKTPNPGKLGLGLSIVRGTVGLLSGNIKVESTIGKGSKFIITVPVYKKDEAQ